jgi:small-conductance mechanosensitive channel
MPLDSYLNDGLFFAALSLALVLVALVVRSPPRTSMLAMLIVVAIGVVSLWLYEYHGGAIHSPTASTVAREAALAFVAFGAIQILVLFVFQTLLARRRIPRILNEFVIVLALIGYAIYRLYVIGVNFAGLITTSAVVSGALALSARETLGNLWGGIALQLEKTCRIGDWVRIDNVTGQVVSIRWRHMAIATINNETIVVPNGALMQNRVTVVGRRGEERTTWRRYVPFNVEYEIPPVRVITEVERALAHAQIPHVAQHTRPIVGCTNFLDSGIEYTVCYDLTNPAEMWNADSQIRVHVYAALLRQGLGIPFPRRVVELRRDERPKRAEREIEHRIAALSTMDLFASLTEDERASLAQQVTTSAYVADEILFRAGEPADSLFLLAQGHVDILREGEKGVPPHKRDAACSRLLRRDGTAARPPALADRRRCRRRPLLPARQEGLRRDHPGASGARRDPRPRARGAPGGERRGVAAARRRNARSAQARPHERPYAAHPELLRALRLTPVRPTSHAATPALCAASARRRRPRA